MRAEMKIAIVLPNITGFYWGAAAALWALISVEGWEWPAATNEVSAAANVVCNRIWAAGAVAGSNLGGLIGYLLMRSSPAYHQLPPARMLPGFPPSRWFQTLAETKVFFWASYVSFALSILFSSLLVPILAGDKNIDIQPLFVRVSYFTALALTATGLACPVSFAILRWWHMDVSDLSADGDK